MDKIIIYNTRDADSRTARENANEEDLRKATEAHIQDVQKCMNFFAEKLVEAGKKHDFTKMDNFDNSYAPLVMQRLPDDEFKASDWYQRHIHTERHHLNSDFKLDINLIDVMEMIADVVTAGNGRSGYLSSKYFNLDTELLYMAYMNTIKMLDDVITVSNKPL